MLSKQGRQKGQLTPKETAEQASASPYFIWLAKNQKTDHQIGAVLMYGQIHLTVIGWFLSTLNG